MSGTSVRLRGVVRGPRSPGPGTTYPHNHTPRARSMRKVGDLSGAVRRAPATADPDRAPHGGRVHHASTLGDLDLAPGHQPAGRPAGRLHQLAPALVVTARDRTGRIGRTDRGSPGASIEQPCDRGLEPAVGLGHVVRHHTSVPANVAERLPKGPRPRGAPRLVWPGRTDSNTTAEGAPSREQENPARRRGGHRRRRTEHRRAGGTVQRRTRPPGSRQRSRGGRRPGRSRGEEAQADGGHPHPVLQRLPRPPRVRVSPRCRPR
jgi:hypothetical protein